MSRISFWSTLGLVSEVWLLEAKTQFRCWRLEMTFRRIMKIAVSRHSFEWTYPFRVPPPTPGGSPLTSQNLWRYSKFCKCRSWKGNVKQLKNISFYMIQVLCWGVRNMKRYQLASVSSPSIEFECGGHVVHSTIIKNTQKNPNFDQPLFFFDVVSVLYRHSSELHQALS